MILPHTYCNADDHGVTFYLLKSNPAFRGCISILLNNINGPFIFSVRPILALVMFRTQFVGHVPSVTCSYQVNLRACYDMLILPIH